jgi:hypothetical protein
MNLDNSGDVDRALQLVGEILAASEQNVAVVILGGAALNLLGLVERATADVDIVAFALPRGEQAPDRASLYEPLEPMPEPLLRAARTVANDLGLDPNWLNIGPALQWRAGLPLGLEERLLWRRYDALWVGIVSRYDLIHFKLFAAADSTGTGSVHYQDLLALEPTNSELSAAATWVAGQDASPEFADVLSRVVKHVRDDLDLS